LKELFYIFPQNNWEWKLGTATIRCCSWENIKYKVLPTKYEERGMFPCCFWFTGKVLEVNRDGDGRLEPILSIGGICTSSCLTSIWGWFLQNDKIASLVRSQQPLRSSNFKVAEGLNEMSPQFVNTASRNLRFISFGRDDK
jgi:hypothetical protein